MNHEDCPVGTEVRCTSPDDFKADLARKLKDRVGVVERFQTFSNLPIILFPAIGRRKELKWVPPSWNYVERAGGPDV